MTEKVTRKGSMLWKFARDLDRRLVALERIACEKGLVCCPCSRSLSPSPVPPEAQSESVSREAAPPGKASDGALLATARDVAAAGSLGATGEGDGLERQGDKSLSAGTSSLNLEKGGKILNGCADRIASGGR